MTDADFSFQVRFPSFARIRSDVWRFVIRAGAALRRLFGKASVASLRLMGMRRFGGHYFNEKFRSPDPWRYCDRDYEKEKYERTLSMLRPAVAGRMLEIGCAEGIFTERLASLGLELLAADISGRALERARARCATLHNVSFFRFDLFEDQLPGDFSVILCSEVLCFAENTTALIYGCQSMAKAVSPKGFVLLVHMRIATEHSGGWPAPDLAFGADSIHRTFHQISGFRLVDEYWTNLYGASLFHSA